MELIKNAHARDNGPLKCKKIFGYNEGFSEIPMKVIIEM